MGEGHHEDLHLEAVEPLLTTQRFGRSLEIREVTDSTNDDARAAANAGAADGHVIVADAQRHGRGARGRSWVSPPGTDLYLSILAKVEVPLAELSVLTLAVGLGVSEAVELLAPNAKAGIKWPNDVWVEGRKIAGVLVEGASLGERALPVVIGIGLNVNRLSFPSDLDTPATSLKLCSGANVSRARALSLLLARVEHWVDSFAASGKAQVVTAVNERLCLRDKPARCDEVTGIVAGVAASGALQLRVDGELCELYAGTLRALT